MHCKPLVTHRKGRSRGHQTCWKESCGTHHKTHTGRAAQGEKQTATNRYTVPLTDSTHACLDKTTPGTVTFYEPPEREEGKKSKPGGRDSHPDCTVFTDRRDASKASPRTNTSHPTTAKLASRPHLFAFAYTLARAQLAGCTTWRGLQPVSHLAR